MMGSFFTRAMLMIFGYVYPAYECYKIVEVNVPEIEHLRFWCQYWILVALLTSFERIADAFVSWLPMYNEAKLVFYVYLWYPKTQGTTYIYNFFFQPFIAKHETEIDRYLLEFKTRVGSVLVKLWQKAASHGQKWFFEVLQYVASHSQEPSKQSVQAIQCILSYPYVNAWQHQLQRQPEAHQTGSASPLPPELVSRRIRVQEKIKERTSCATGLASSSEAAATHRSPTTEEATQTVTLNGEEPKSPLHVMAVDDAMRMKLHGWFRRRPPAVDP